MYALGAVDAFDALVYPETHPATVNFLRNQVSNLSSTLNDVGRAFMERSQMAFNTFNNSDALNFTRRVISTVKGKFQTEYITELTSIEEMQNASLTMQRWIMANPEVRALYHKQRVDGYSDSYLDLYGQSYGDDHYDYRRVNDGVMHITEDDWYVKEYIEELVNGDRDLTFAEKIDIHNTWDNMKAILSVMKEDPTNPDGGSM